MPIPKLFRHGMTVLFLGGLTLAAALLTFTGKKGDPYVDPSPDGEWDEMLGI